jgi:hypothetical protein
MSFLILIIIYPLIKALTMYNLINSIWWLFCRRTILYIRWNYIWS